MHCIRMIRWIDPMPGGRLCLSRTEGKTMKGQQDCFGNHFHAVTHPASPAAPSLWRRWRRWLQLARERRELLRLSDEALKDLGLSRADIFREGERHFWDDPLRRH
ncbi:DUF1127 domain-containing protein [Pseudomonas aeruginosa]|nr:DUF1127 domain-containing protein [Pseudomonas aeruginosa]NQB01320.1 DUF1127 domain-containing protein [Pseudomonas paraeruginosa]MBG4201225.1 DUF1127 domain-containing protein [Pseudomonas aeruginosa]MBG4280604.1 DUF1127 domain-containing protein [Pseudomonas aeruginosa]MBG5754361.1 DUF1127 domain-containing protein [Pseudomonas aeruginosa]